MSNALSSNIVHVEDELIDLQIFLLSLRAADETVFVASGRASFGDRFRGFEDTTSRDFEESELIEARRDELTASLGVLMDILEVVGGFAKRDDLFGAIVGLVVVWFD